MDAKKKSWIGYVVPVSWLEGKTVRLKWYRAFIGVVYGIWGLLSIMRASSGAGAVGEAVGVFVGFVLFAYGLPRFFRWLEEV